MKKLLTLAILLTCIQCSPDQEVVQIYKGEKGDSGTTCFLSVMQPSEESLGGALITCGDSVAFVSNGTSGLNGTNGSDGADGLSAYELWLQDGNEGTLSEFLDSLIGADGQDGSDGSDGQDASATITSYTSSSCTAVSGTSFYVKSNGSTTGVYDHSSCHSSDKEFEMGEGDSMWLSSSLLAVKLVDTNGIRVIKFQ